MLFTYSCFNCRNEKGLLNFVSERIKLVYRINNTRYNFQKNKLPFKHLKPQFIGRILSNLSPYLNISYCFTGRALKIYDLLLWSRWNRTHKYVRCTGRESRIRSEMSWSSIYTKNEALNSCITVHSVWIMKIFNLMPLTICSRNKGRKNCEESRWRSQSALFRPLAMSCLNRCQDLIGS